MTDHVHVSDLRWDRLLAGELADDAKAEMLAAADACAVCGARLAELRRDHEAFAQRPPLVAVRPRGRRWWLAAPAVLAAAAALLLVVRLRPAPGPSERPKGSDVSFVVAAGRPGSMAVVTSGDRVYPGDSLQVGYSAPRAGYGAVLSRDGGKGLSAYVPYRGGAMIALPAGDQQLFPESTVLDAVLGEETLIVLWCDRPYELELLLAELAAKNDIARPAGCTVQRIVLHKVAR